MSLLKFWKHAAVGYPTPSNVCVVEPAPEKNCRYSADLAILKNY